MSQQGIFSIAPDAQTGTQDARTNGGAAGNASPFTTVSTAGTNGRAQNSPFTSVSEESPFQQVESGELGGGGIPQRRPEGQSSALGGGGAESEVAVQARVEPELEAGQNIFEVAQKNAGGAFQMNGFPAQGKDQVMEAAPVASAPESSPFVAVKDDRPDYEAAKAGLEPQQDFAAVPPRYAPAQQVAPVEEVRAVSAPQVVVAPAAIRPAVAVVTPVFQQLELRAIFGVDRVLDVVGILQRARTLPGIRNVAVVGDQEAVALSNFRLAMQGMGFGDAEEMKLNAGGGTVDFISEGGTTVAVLLEGGYAPGVQETLIIVAREIGKLS